MPLGGASEGNKLTLYNNGDDAFTAMWDAISSAKKRVWMETYILEPGVVARKTIDELTRASLRGVDVKLIYDYVGSQKLRSKDVEGLKNCGKRILELNCWSKSIQNFSFINCLGAQVIAFNPLLSWPWRIHLGFWRNHKKILVVDDNTAFTGGMNIGDQYAGPHTGGNGYLFNIILLIRKILS